MRLIRIFLFSIILQIQFFIGFGQPVDSLLNLVEKSESNNLKASRLIELSQYYFMKNLDSCEMYMSKAFELRDKGVSDSMAIVITVNYINAHIEQRREQAKEEVIQEGINYLKQKGARESLAKVLNRYGAFYSYKNQLHQALEMYQKSLELDLEMGADSVSLAKSYANIASMLHKMGRVEESITEYHRAIAILKETAERNSVFKIYIDLANIYANPAVSNQEFYNLDSAIFYAKESVSITEKINFPFGVAKCKRILATIMVLQEHVTQQHAKEGLEMALAAKKFFENRKGRDYYLSLLVEGTARFILGETKVPEQRANELIQAQKFQEESYNLLHKVYAKQNDWQQALEYHKLFKRTKDSLERAKNKAMLADIQEKYETARKETEITKLTKENELEKLKSQQNRNYFIGAVLIAILILGLSVIAYNQLKMRRKADLIKADLEASRMQIDLERQFREAELKALKSQMNPHFIFNALNSIQEYIILNEKELAANYLGKFADLIRSYLYYSNQGKISLSEDIQALTLYLELEQVRFEDDFKFEITKYLKSAEDTLEIPTMLIQPYVENAIKHGLLHKSGDKKLKIIFTEQPNTLVCEVIDNGVGRKRSAEINARRYNGHKSFASEATQSRLELLNHNSKGKIGVQITDLQDGNDVLGTKVTLSIPIDNN